MSGLSQEKSTTILKSVALTILELESLLSHDPAMPPFRKFVPVKFEVHSFNCFG